MSGLDMMMKSFGLDPKAITETIQGLGKLAVDIKEQLGRIEAKMDAIEVRNAAIEKRQNEIFRFYSEQDDKAVITIPNFLEKNDHV